MTLTISGLHIQTDLNDLVAISISSEEEEVIDLSEKIPFEKTALLPIEPKRFSILTNGHILIALATSIVIVIVGVILLITNAAVYTGAGFTIVGSIASGGTLMIMDRET
jgi:hypothetical protein